MTLTENVCTEVGVFKEHTTYIISEERSSKKSLLSISQNFLLFFASSFFFVCFFSSLLLVVFLVPCDVFPQKKIYTSPRTTRRELEMKRILKQVLDNSKSSISLTSSRSEVVLVGGFRRTTVTPTVAARGVSSAFTRSSTRVGKKSIATTSTASSFSSLDGNDDETANTASSASKKKNKYPSKFDSNEKVNKDFTPNRYQTREENELKTKQMREVKRKEYLEKIVKSENNRDFQSSDHANAIGGDGTVTKYYENVDIREVSSTQNQYEILLDGKPLKSPKRAQFILPNKLLASAIATEWATQEDDSIRPFTMPLMQLSSTALDHMSDYATFDFHVKKLLEFFDADQAVVAHPSGSELREIQLKTLKKVHDWARREFGEQLNLSSDSIFAQPQPEEVKILMEKRLRSLSPWEMTCTFAAAAAAKSLLIGLALNRNIIDPEEALKCARVEEDYQIERHGFVEGGHDIDISDLRVRLTAPHALNLILKAKMGTM